MKKILMTLAAVATLTLSFSGIAQAAGNTKYQQECGSCHVAYPPGLLPAASWGRIMSGLNKHFGTDASLDESTTRDIGNWLQVNAGSGRRSEEPPQDRISKANWFVRQHDEVSASTFKRASIGSAANCSACHAGAAKGDFNEHAVHIPK